MKQLQQKQKNQQTKKFKEIEWELIFITYTSNLQKICLATKFDNDLLIELTKLPHFIIFHTNDKEIFIIGDAYRFQSMLQFLILIRYQKEQLEITQKLINSLIRVVYQYFSKSYFTNMIVNGILNQNNFLYHENNIKNYFDEFYFDHLSIPFSVLYNRVGDLIYDLLGIHIYTNDNKSDVLSFSMREIFSSKIFKDSHSKIFEEFKLLYGLDITIDNIWKTKYTIEDDEDIDEPVEDEKEEILQE